MEERRVEGNDLVKIVFIIFIQREMLMREMLMREMLMREMLILEYV